MSAARTAAPIDVVPQPLLADDALDRVNHVQPGSVAPAGWKYRLVSDLAGGGKRHGYCTSDGRVRDQKSLETDSSNK
jgi:hypothetical protein